MRRGSIEISTLNWDPFEGIEARVPRVNGLSLSLYNRAEALHAPGADGNRTGACNMTSLLANRRHIAEETIEKWERKYHKMIKWDIYNEKELSKNINRKFSILLFWQ